ncbi:MAG: DUF3461 family protein [Chromatiales bacterium]|nr:MAG: DUF3461 family protein [Chromatiales bacterium]
MNKSKTNPYPTLNKMGVESPKQIANYYISSINFIDVLRIVYERPKDSYLPSSRTYKFPRVPSSDASEGQKDKEAGVLRTHPMLRSALEELQQIFAARSSKESIAAEILNEIALLEEDIAMRSECLKVLVSKIPAVD